MTVFLVARTIDLDLPSDQLSEVKNYVQDSPHFRQTVPDRQKRANQFHWSRLVFFWSLVEVRDVR